MGHLIARPIRDTRIFCAELTQSLAKIHATATASVASATDPADRAVARERLARVQAVIDHAEALQVTTGGPHERVTGTAFAVLLYAADDIHDDASGSMMHPGANWHTRAYISNVAAGAAAGVSAQAGRKALRDLVAAGYMTAIATSNQKCRYALTPLVTAWWERFMTSGFWAVYQGLGPNGGVYVPSWVRQPAASTNASEEQPTPLPADDETQTPEADSVIPMQRTVRTDDVASVLARKKGLAA